MTSFYFHNDELNEIIESFYDRTNHQYLQKYIEKPVIDKDQASLLYLMLKDKACDISFIKQCIITTILVQAALDTHERISVHPPYINESNNKTQQLTVLAGDYYSSLYYYFLSMVDDVSLIRVLAQSIQEINESKMNVYKNNDKQVKASLNDVKLIDSSLLKNIATLLKLPAWKKTVEEFFFFKRLLRERLMFTDNGVQGALAELFLTEYDRKESVQEDYVLQRFDRQIELSKDKLIIIAHEWTSLRSYILTRIQDLIIENRYTEQFVVEEG